MYARHASRSHRRAAVPRAGGAPVHDPHRPLQLWRQGAMEGRRLGGGRRRAPCQDSECWCSTIPTLTMRLRGRLGASLCASPRRWAGGMSLSPANSRRSCQRWLLALATISTPPPLPLHPIGWPRQALPLGLRTPVPPLHNNAGRSRAPSSPARATFRGFGDGTPPPSPPPLRSHASTAAARPR